MLYKYWWLCKLRDLWLQIIWAILSPCVSALMRPLFRSWMIWSFHSGLPPLLLPTPNHIQTPLNNIKTNWRPIFWPDQWLVFTHLWHLLTANALAKVWLKSSLSFRIATPFCCMVWYDLSSSADVKTSQIGINPLMNCAVSNRQGVRVRDGLKVPMHQLKKLTACRMEMNGNHMETIWKPYGNHMFGSMVLDLVEFLVCAWQA